MQERAEKLQAQFVVTQTELAKLKQQYSALLAEEEKKETPDPNDKKKKEK